jgi:hypothetical protein
MGKAYSRPRRHDPRHNEIQHNDIQLKIKWNVALGKTTLTVMAVNTEYCYAESHLFRVSIMPSVANKPFVLSVIIIGNVI